MRRLEKLQPQPLWNYFEDICQVPRPSKKEEKIIRFLLDFAERNKLEAKRDEIGTVFTKTEILAHLRAGKKCRQ